MTEDTQVYIKDNRNNDEDYTVEQFSATQRVAE